MSKKLLSVLMSTLLLGQFVLYVPANAAPYSYGKSSKKERKRLKEEKRKNRNNTIKRIALFGVGAVAFAVGTGALYNELKESNDAVSPDEFYRTIMKVYYSDHELADEFLRFNARSVYATTKIADAIEKLQIVFNDLRCGRITDAKKLSETQKALKEVGCGEFLTNDDCIALMEYAKHSYQLDSYLRSLDKRIESINDSGDKRTLGQRTADMRSLIAKEKLLNADKFRFLAKIDDLFNKKRASLEALDRIETLTKRLLQARKEYVECGSKLTHKIIKKSQGYGFFVNDGPDDWQISLNEAKAKWEKVLNALEKAHVDCRQYRRNFSNICNIVESFAKDLKEYPQYCRNGAEATWRRIFEDSDRLVRAQY